MTDISTEDLYQLVVNNPRYLEAVLRFLESGELPPELAGKNFPNLERVAAEIKQGLRETKPEGER